MRTQLVFAFTVMGVLSSCMKSPQVSVPLLTQYMSTPQAIERPSPTTYQSHSTTPRESIAVEPRPPLDAYRSLSFSSTDSDRTIGIGANSPQNYRLTDDQGNVTQVRTDYLGGYKSTDSNGNVSRSRPDGFGGWRTTHENGSVSRSRSDGLGGYRVIDDDGNTTSLKADGFGGYRGHDDAGNYYRVRQTPF